jgi:uncharacterized membrane protein
MAQGGLPHPDPSQTPDVHSAVSGALRLGVTVSLVLLAAAVVAAALEPPHRASGWPSVIDPATGSVRWPPALAFAGLLVLMATPILRLVVAIVCYWRSDERVYAWIAAAVLAVVLSSVWVGLRAMPKRGERPSRQVSDAANGAYASMMHSSRLQFSQTSIRSVSCTDRTTFKGRFV